MAIDPGERFGLDVETRLHVEITRKLGAEAAERFFNQLPEKLSKRAKTLAKQAKVLELLLEMPLQAQPSFEEDDASIEADDAKILHIHSEESESAPNHETSEQDHANLVIVTENMPDDMQPDSTLSNIEPCLEHEKSEWSLSNRFKYFYDGIAMRKGAADELGVTYDDKDVIVSILCELGGNTKLQSARPPYVLDILSTMYDGLSRAESAKLFGTIGQTISNRLAPAQSRIIAKLIENKIDLNVLILERIEAARDLNMTAATEDNVPREKAKDAASKLDQIYGPLPHEKMDDTELVRLERNINEETPSIEEKIELPIKPDDQRVVLPELHAAKRDADRVVMNPPTREAGLAFLSRQRRVTDVSTEKTEENFAKAPHLWDIAQGKAEASADAWHTAFMKMFEKAVADKQLTRAEVEMLKPRMLGEDTERTIHQDVRSALNKLQKLASQVEVNLDQDPETKKIFNMFTITVLGANTLDDIVAKLNRDHQNHIGKKKVRNKLAGGIAYVLEGGNK